MGTADGRYVFDIQTLGDEGTWTLANRRVFAHCDKGFPDGIKCDTLGNVYSGCGDGVHVLPRIRPLLSHLRQPSVPVDFKSNHCIVVSIFLFMRCANRQVWNASGRLIGKIALGEPGCGNLVFGPDKSLFIFAETRIYRVDLAVDGAPK